MEVVDLTLEGRLEEIVDAALRENPVDPLVDQYLQVFAKMQDVKAVLFDMGGTLIQSDGYVRFAEGPKPMDAMQPGAYILLNALLSIGVPVGIVSNTSIEPELIDDAFKRIGLNIDVTIYSSDPHVNASKPNPHIYRVALECMDIKHRITDPKNILFVGDHYINDVMFPHDMGMKTAYLYLNDDQEGSGVPTAKLASERLGKVYPHATLSPPDLAHLHAILKATAFPTMPDPPALTMRT